MKDVEVDEEQQGQVFEMIRKMSGNCEGDDGPKWLSHESLLASDRSRIRHAFEYRLRFPRCP